MQKMSFGTCAWASAIRDAMCVHIEWYARCAKQFRAAYGLITASGCLQDTCSSYRHSLLTRASHARAVAQQRAPAASGTGQICQISAKEDLAMRLMSPAVINGAHATYMTMFLSLLPEPSVQCSDSHAAARLPGTPISIPAVCVGDRLTAPC